MSESFSINLSIHFESLKGCEDNIIVVRSTSHLAGKKCDHLGEVHGSVNLVEHGLGFSTSNVLSVGSKSSLKVGGGQKAVLVGVHDAKGFLELLGHRMGRPRIHQDG